MKYVITQELERNSIHRFKDIFDLYHYSKEVLSLETGISGERLSLVIEKPESILVEEIAMLAEHFEVDMAVFWEIISRQAGFVR